MTASTRGGIDGTTARDGFQTRRWLLPPAQNIEGDRQTARSEARPAFTDPGVGVATLTNPPTTFTHPRSLCV
jgi:hypothetical protein